VIVSAEPNGTRVRLAVSDSGPGIKRAELERIFEPFYTSDDARGSGLGLAIARELAERMNGQLAARSTPGRTTFSLELPV
jgi:signal transduction histidine kinase